jgi:hypothetical protein
MQTVRDIRQKRFPGKDSGGAAACYAARRTATGAGGQVMAAEARAAEMQLQILWEEVLKRGLRIEVMGPPVRAYSNFLRGIRALPVRIAA